MSPLYEVISGSAHWEVRLDGKPLGRWVTRELAIDWARRLARAERGDLVIYNHNGTVQARHTYRDTDPA